MTVHSLSHIHVNYNQLGRPHAQRPPRLPHLLQSRRDPARLQDQTAYQSLVQLVHQYQERQLDQQAQHDLLPEVPQHRRHQRYQ